MDKAGLVGDNLTQGKNDHKSGGVFDSLFLSSKKVAIDIYGYIQEHKILNDFKFNDSKRLLDRSQYFRMRDGNKISAILPGSW